MVPYKPYQTIFHTNPKIMFPHTRLAQSFLWLQTCAGFAFLAGEMHTSGVGLLSPLALIPLLPFPWFPSPSQTSALAFPAQYHLFPIFIPSLFSVFYVSGTHLCIENRPQQAGKYSVWLSGLFLACKQRINLDAAYAGCHVMAGTEKNLRGYTDGRIR